MYIETIYKKIQNNLQKEFKMTEKKEVNVDHLHGTES